MKKRGFALALLLAISGILRLAGPEDALAPRTEVPDKKKQATPAKSVTTTYPDALQRTIDEFGSSPNACFVIAILADPVHTHLALSFDRGIAALQQAAQRMGYSFDRAILPWDINPANPSDDIEKRQAALQEQRERESYPGLLIFRKGAHRRQPDQTNLACGDFVNADTQPLFVFVVGESPTGGLRKQQFRRALVQMTEIAGKAIEGRPLRVLGPTFSGSLDSLNTELKRISDQRPDWKIYVYSGSVTDAVSIKRFSRGPATLHFSSFQENDEYTRDRFIQFICSKDYPPNEIATLSEDETVFGALSRSRPADSSEQTSPDHPHETHAEQLEACKEDYATKGHKDVIQLHFPREISYFRSAYQKEIAAQQRPEAKSIAPSTLRLDLREEGRDDDAVSLYATAQTPLSQEAVMRGILTELQKHHVKFTILYASDPADQLFLARYLRTGFPQGRVVITDPDLLFSREEDALLRGVLGISAYALVPGLSDELNPWGHPEETHRDQLFVSGISVGTYNAMLGLLSVTGEFTGDNVPYAPYDSYGIETASDPKAYEARPVLWLTILGRDGFWPIVGLTAKHLDVGDKQLPVAFLGRLPDEAGSTLKPEVPPASSQSAANPATKGSTDQADHADKVRRPSSWKIAYWLCLLMLVAHTFLSSTGSILADSEASTQFARTPEWRDATIVALGALALATAFVVIMFTGSPVPFWSRSYFSGWTPILWLPFPLFVVATLWDLGKLREKKYVAVAFAVALFLIICWQILAWYDQPAWLSIVPLFKGERINVYWSARVLHFSSGLSPVLPVLLLLGAGYWWMWQSLRGVTLVDLRRPRLPQKADLGSFSYRLSEVEADELRVATHPFFFTWRVWAAIFIPSVFGLSTVLDLNHPVQTVEGEAYDWGYTSLLALMLAAFLTCLFKLVWTWFKCRQILASLDHLPLREAFSRMERLSWHSLWNPGGSTLRETYKLMSRGFENIIRLKGQMQDWGAPLTDAARRRAIDQMEKIAAKREDALKIYGRIVADEKDTGGIKGKTGKSSVDLAAILARVAFFLRIRPFSAAVKKRSRKYQARSNNLLLLLQSIEIIQAEMAKLTAHLMSDVLKPLWDDDSAPVVSVDKRTVTPPISPLRALAEEYAALTYVNFLVTVLLRMRTMVVCATGMYVFIVVSMNVYPFEPHPALQTLAIVLLVLLGAVVAYVYAEMHREAILSRLTSKGTGELGWDFWLKLASAGAIPVFSLLAVQFPEINQFLFSWLEPALQAVK